MELSTELNRVKNIFIVHVRGQYRRPDDGFEIQRFILDSFTEHGCRRILLDLTETEIIAGEVQTYETAHPKPEVVNELRKFRFAFVYSEVTEDDHFLENLAVNRGVFLMAFDNLDTAIKWLEQ